MKLRKLLAMLLITMGTLSMVSCGSTVEEAEEVSEPVELVVNDDEPDEEDTAEEEETAIIEEEEKQDAEAAEMPADEEADPAGEPVEETPAEAAPNEPVINWDEVTKLDEPVIMYAQSKLNVRKGPDTTFDSVGSLAINDEVQVVGTCNDSPWKEISYNDGIAFVHGGYLSTEQVDLEALRAQQEAAAQAAAEAAERQQPEVAATEQAAPAEPAPAPQPEAAPAPQPEVPEPAGILFIGDSRTCQMQVATQGAGCSWICEYGTKYEWFETTAIPKADKLVGQGTKVVICMGVNDPGSCRSYASLTNSKAGVWRERGATVYYVSLNPTAQPYDDKNAAIDNFNASMPGMLSGVNWIDTASTVKQGGYTLVDGIHYDAVSNVNIFNLICGRL